jgi:sec-independent protein translocase protein TatA
MWMPGTIEWIIIAVVALLIFGRRLPEVARSVGKSIVEFKKGIKDVKDDIDVRSRLEAPPPRPLEQKPESNEAASPASEPSEEPTSASNKA